MNVFVINTKLQNVIENEKKLFHRDRNWKESHILQIEISWDRYNLERTKTLSNQRNYH